jgi:hypothetical protein
MPDRHLRALALSELDGTVCIRSMDLPRASTEWLSGSPARWRFRS